MHAGDLAAVDDHGVCVHDGGDRDVLLFDTLSNAFCVQCLPRGVPA